jgi:hypothetical protein
MCFVRFEPISLHDVKKLLKTILCLGLLFISLAALGQTEPKTLLLKGYVLGSDTNNISKIDHVDNNTLNTAIQVINTKMLFKDNSTYYLFPANSFDQLFLTFYNLLQANTGYIPGLSIYGGPPLTGGVATNTSNFTVIRFEKPQ